VRACMLACVCDLLCNLVCLCVYKHVSIYVVYVVWLQMCDSYTINRLNTANVLMTRCKRMRQQSVHEWSRVYWPNRYVRVHVCAWLHWGQLRDRWVFLYTRRLQLDVVVLLTIFSRRKTN